MHDRRYDVIIAGASFGGLGVLSKIEDNNILIIDENKIGERRTSTCATWANVIKDVGSEDSIIQEFEKIKLHSQFNEYEFKLKNNWCTIDYSKFCKNIIENSNADFIQASAKKVNGSKVITNVGDFEGKIIVDSTGWRSTLSKQNNQNNPQSLSFGIETDVPFKDDSLHFFIDKTIINWGGAWIFPAGKVSRMGIGSYNKSNLIPELKNFLKRYNFKIGRLTGSYIPASYREPVVGNIFVVGDAAGQTLPFTAEGIRKAIVNGRFCGSIINRILSNEISLDEGLIEYKNYIERKRINYKILSFLQENSDKIPAIFIDILFNLASKKELSRYVKDFYLNL